mmetsp:Transcript_93516/g.185533  ORF Transcript_93516/g.185533 Transcript_93516/m.185533 type:complete len:919 (+) Transcript_93516:178-2934(+)
MAVPVENEDSDSQFSEEWVGTTASQETSRSFCDDTPHHCAQNRGSKTLSRQGSLACRSRQLIHWHLNRMGWHDSCVATSIRRFLRGQLFSAFTLLCLLIALFLSEVWTILQVATNAELDAILTTVFVVFLLELLGLSLTDMSYLFGFFFWMDLLGTLSITFDISYMAGQDATQPLRVSYKEHISSGQNMVFARTARAARLEARAGRLGRVLKILRFLPFLLSTGNQRSNSQVKTARVMSNQLTNFLSIRVAFITISIAGMLPLFGLLRHPQADDSMVAWTEVLDRTAVPFQAAVGRNSSTLATAMAMPLEGAMALDEALRLWSEVRLFAEFYAAMDYGPFAVKYGERHGDSFYVVLDVPVPSTFTSPRRQSSAYIITAELVEASFDLSAPDRKEAAATVGLVFFVIVVMCSFGLSMNNCVYSTALTPLEKMLRIVRKRCAEIFAYTDNLERRVCETSSHCTGTSTMAQTSEFEMLECVLEKMADIAKLLTAEEPETKDEMSEGEIMVLNWMQGSRVTTRAANKSPTATMVRVPTLPLVVAPDSLIQGLASTDFDPLNLSTEMNVAMAGYMITAYEGCCIWVQAYVHERQLRSFLTQLAAAYQPNPFHNFAHAVDVEHCCRTYMTLAKAKDFLSDVAQFWLLIAAVGHDVGHTGVNNRFLVEIQHELAMRYNDRSPLENMHCARLFEIASQPQSNIFSQVQKCLFNEMRKSMIAAILHTDVARHDEIVRGICLLYQINSEAFDAQEPGPAISPSNTNMQLVLNSLLHTADVSNTMKPWELCQRLAHLCLDEFFAQGDLEKASGLPVQTLNDRDRVNRSHSQVGFGEFLILPLATGMIRLFPRLDYLALHLSQNMQRWSDLWRNEVKPGPEELTRVQLRVQRVADECAKLVRGEDRKRPRSSCFTVLDGTSRSVSKRGTI